MPGITPSVTSGCRAQVTVQQQTPQHVGLLRIHGCDVRTSPHHHQEHPPPTPTRLPIITRQSKRHCCRGNNHIRKHRQLSPPPSRGGHTIPTAPTKTALTRPKDAAEEAMITSHSIASSQPPPSATPFTAAMRGVQYLRLVLTCCQRANSCCLSACTTRTATQGARAGGGCLTWRQGSRTFAQC